MCTGVETVLLIASAAASAAGAYAQYDGQRKQANYTDKANDIARHQIELEADAARADQERMRTQQAEQAASETNAYEDAARKQRASLDALIGEYGGGNTGERRLATLGMAQGQDLATMQSNAQKASAEAGFQGTAALSSINSKVTGLTPGMKPSSTGLALNLASTALTAGSRYQTINNPKPGAGTK